MRYAIAILLLVAADASATPYLRLLDLSKPQVSAGAFVDPSDPGNSSAGSMLALVTHSNRDGCLIPSITCEDWTPLAVGFATRSGKTVFALGPSVNLAPIVKASLLWVFNSTTDSGSYSGVKSALGSERLDRKDISVAFGPNLVLSPSENWKGYLRIFTGAAWKF